MTANCSRGFMALAACAALALASHTIPASAETLSVFDGTLPSGVKAGPAAYDVDETTGIVRIAVDFTDDSFEPTTRTERVAVPALRFDPHTGEVRTGQGVVCAVARKELWATVYRETGACRMTVTNEPTAGEGGERVNVASVAISFAGR